MELTSYLLGKKAGGGGGSNLQTKSITVTENGSITINPDENYDGMSKVNLTANVPTGDPNKKAFQTQATTEMGNLSTMKEDDLCVVYSDTHDELVIPTAGTNTYYFPKHVTLPNAITEEDSTTTSGNQLTGMYVFTINPTSFTLAFKNIAGTQPKIEYTSSDGINYIRTSEDNTYTFSNSITEEKAWLPYFIIMNRQTEYIGTYNYTEDDEWDRVAVPNLIAGNVKENVTILGVTGTYAGDGVEKDVNFYDYLGNLVYSYTAQEFQALTELPAGPTHEGMTFQEWNYTLSAAKSYVTNHGELDIGETCITSDGKTRIYIDLPEGSLAPALGFAVNGSVTVDWGDNNTETVTGSSTSTLIQTTHTYATHGKYTITLQSSSTIYFVGYGTTCSGLLLDSTGSTGTYGTIGLYRAYSTFVRKIELGSNVSLGAYCFAGLTIESINIPTSITTAGNYCLGWTTIQCIVFPKGMTSTPTHCFEENQNLKKVILSSTIQTIGDDTFYRCDSLEKIELPDSVTSVGAYAIYGTSIKKVVFSNSITNINKAGTISSTNVLKEIKLPPSLTQISTNKVFSSCGAVNSIEIPATVTSLSNQCFGQMWGLSHIKFLGNYSSTFMKWWEDSLPCVIDMRNNTAVPAISITLPSRAKLVVPDSLYETWITTGNWANYTSQIVKASEYTG